MSTSPSSHDGHVFTNKLLAVKYLAQHYDIKLPLAWRYKKTNNTLQASMSKTKEIYSNIFISNALNIESQEGDKSSKDCKKMDSLIKELLTNIHSPTLIGNNYAVSNTTIASNYSSLINQLFNRFYLPH